MARRFYSDHPPRAEYALSEKGRELGVIVGALAAWGSRHVHPQTALVHAECGHPVELKYFCAPLRRTGPRRHRGTAPAVGLGTGGRRAARSGGPARGARSARRAPRG